MSPETGHRRMAAVEGNIASSSSTGQTAFSPTAVLENRDAGGGLNLGDVYA
jgi:hypothetical protein